MRHTVLIVAVLLARLAMVRAAAATQPVLRVPEGFVVERVAGPPVVQRPMVAGFDERGRLFVAESAGKNVDFKKLAADPPNFVRMLEDTDGDGVFDKSTIFADRMTFPSGALWHEGALYVCSPPGLWKLEDTNGDGVCDKRTEIVTGFGSIGNGADLHGPYLGPDGWLYFCDGRNGHDVMLGDGTRWTGKAACVYRCRTDGSGLEVVFGGGFDNPVAVAFTPAGEPLVSCNLVMATPQRLDGILYGIEGGVYPYAGCISEFARTGELLKPVGDLGWVAVSGMVRCEGGAMGSELESKLFTAQFNRHRVQRHIVARDGAGFRIGSEDFLTCESVDFHPTDVLMDRDGSLLVIDTGGWFRIGCPQSQVEKPTVLGGIYRVRRSGANRGSQNAQTRASDEIWALARQDTPAARAAVRAAIENANSEVRRTAIRAAGLARDTSAATAVLRCLPANDLTESREAALALARIGDKSATAPLLAELKRSSDRFHEHAVIYALERIGDATGTRAGLADANPAVVRGALVALDQMRGGNLTADEVIGLLGSPHAAVRQEAITIVTSRTQWAGKVAEALRSLLTQSQFDDAARAGIRGMIVAFAGDAAVQAIITESLGNAAGSGAVKRLLLEAIAAAPVETLPQPWRDAVGRALRSEDEAQVRQAVELVRARGLDTFDEDLRRIAHQPACATDLRVAALTAAAPRIKADAECFALLLGQLDKKHSLLERLAAAQCIARFSLDEAQLTMLASGAAPDAGPMELTQLLGAFEKSSSATVGHALVASLLKSKAALGLSPAALRQALRKYPADVAQSAEPLLKQLEASAAQQKGHLDELAPLLSGGEASRGQSVFLGRTAGCTTCHAVGGIGAHVGPDLSKIGAMRSGRDLLESIVYPSASIARGFEPFVVETKDGKVYAGTLAGESAEAIRLNTPAETMIPRSQIKLLRPDRVSIMPQGLEAQLSKQDLSDLLAFLQACK